MEMHIEMMIKNAEFNLIDWAVLYLFNSQLTSAHCQTLSKTKTNYSFGALSWNYSQYLAIFALKLKYVYI